MIKESTLHSAHAVYREVVAAGKSVQVAYDYAQGKSVPLSEDFRAKLEAAY